MASARTSAARTIAGVLVTLTVTAGAVYLMFLYALALSFDGPGALSGWEAVQWLALAIGTVVAGVGGGAFLGWLVSRSWRASAIAAVPGLVVCTFLLATVVGNVVDLVNR